MAEREARSWFPLFLDLKDRPCLVAGGGAVALRKARELLSFGARVTVVAREARPELEKLPVTLIRRAVRPGDASGMALAVDATGDEEAGSFLQADCRAGNIPLNTVDVLSRCDFIFPAVLRRGPLVAAVSTGGSSPAAAAWVRDRLEAAMPDGLEEILEQMADLRAESRERFHDPALRGEWLKRCFAAAVEKGEPLSRRELEELL